MFFVKNPANGLSRASGSRKTVSCKMSKPGNRRISKRIAFTSKAICKEIVTGKQYCGTLHDISISGMFIEMAECPTISSRCAINIIFEGDHSRLMIENVSGEIVRSNQGGVAICFDKRLEWFVLIPLFYHKLSSTPGRELFS